MSVSKKNKQHDTISWDLGDGRTVELGYDLSTKFDVNEVVNIDINNLMGEYLTAPVLFNTIANLRSKAMEALSRKKLEKKLYENDLFLKTIKSFEGQKKPSNPEIDAMVSMDEGLIMLEEEFIDSERNSSMLDNLYWAIKEKCEKLNNLYHKITPEEFKKEIMEGQINNVLIRIHKERK